MALEKRPKTDNWFIVFTHQGQRYRKATGTTSRREAEAIERAYRAEIEASAAKPLTPTIAVLRDLDIARAREEGRTQKYIDKDIVSYFKYLQAYFQTADKVTEDSLVAYVKHRRAQGVRRQTVSKELAMLKRGLRLGRIKGPDFWPRLGRDVPDPKKASKRHDAAVWHSWLSRLHGEALHLALFALLTGLRRGELYRVLPEDVSGNILTVKEKVRRPSPRQIVLSPHALAIAKVAVPFKHEHKKAFLTASRPGKSITLRDCRAAFATAGDTSGDSRAVDLAMGHSGVPARYQKTDYDRLGRVSEAVTHWVITTLGYNLDNPDILQNR